MIQRISLGAEVAKADSEVYTGYDVSTQESVDNATAKPTD